MPISDWEVENRNLSPNSPLQYYSIVAALKIKMLGAIPPTSSILKSSDKMISDIVLKRFVVPRHLLHVEGGNQINQNEAVIWSGGDLLSRRTNCAIVL